ncbi:hypothetical protein [Sulfitobacter sp. M13]
MLVSDILHHLTTMPLQRTADLPRDKVGIYGLADHEGRLRYFGSTSSTAENFRKRIHQRHRTGSENRSHYFSKVYNTGRMWRDPVLHRESPDAKISKDLRSAFIADHCRAVWIALDGTKSEIESLERALIAAAPPECCSWNANTGIRYPEPVGLVDELMEALQFSESQRAAVERQAGLFHSDGMTAA